MGTRKLKALALSVLIVSGQAKSTDFSIRIVDGLGRPVPDVQVELAIPPDGSANGAGKTASDIHFQSDRLGHVVGSIDGTLIHSDPPVFTFRKKGYGLRVLVFAPDLNVVLPRSFGKDDLARFEKSEGQARIDLLREILGGAIELDWSDPGPCPIESMTWQGGRCHEALLSLMSDPHVGGTAVAWLAKFAIPGDMARIVASTPAHGKYLVSSLIEPTTEEEWQILRHAALGDFGEDVLPQDAFDTLRMNGSPRSVEILKEVEATKPRLKRDARYARRFIGLRYTPVADSDIVAAGRRFGLAYRYAWRWAGNEKPHFSQDRRIATIDCNYVIYRSLLIYRGTFHQVDGRWRLRGVKAGWELILPSNDPRVGPYWYPYRGGKHPRWRTATAHRT